MRKNSIKNTRINAQVQQVLAETIRGEIKDPRIAPLTSVVAVEVAPDLKTCRAWISVLGDEKAQADTLEGLRSAVGFIRSRLAKEINLRITPEITFVMDQSIAYGVNMSHKIDEVMENKCVIIDCKNIKTMDISAVFALEDLILTLKSRKIEPVIIFNNRQLAASVLRLGVRKLVKNEAVTFDEAEARRSARALIGE